MILCNFYPRPPRGGRRALIPSGAPLLDFYPRPPRGGRRWMVSLTCPVMLFLSTPSARRATGNPSQNCREKAISIHALREEGDLEAEAERVLPAIISIHALREEGDRRYRRRPTPAVNFYPRPPRGGRLTGANNRLLYCGFLSTPSARRATRCPSADSAGSWYFYPRPPRGGRLCHIGASLHVDRISIHALREEGDESWSTASEAIFKFLSTPSARRATFLPARL